MFITYCDTSSTRITDICDLDFINIIASLVTTVCLGISLIYLFIYHKSRCNELFHFHNVRAVIFIALFLLNLCEVAERTLAINIPKGFSYHPLGLVNAWLSVLSLITIIIFNRCIEIRDKTGWLYLAVATELFLFIGKICKVGRISQVVDLFCIQSILMGCTSLLLGLLIFIDSYTIYKETNPKKSKKNSHFYKENIGYRHTYSTFLSKIVFWWMTPILWKGYWEPLELEDLGQLHEEESSRSYYDHFLYIYQSVKNKNASLWITYFKSNWKMFTYGGVLKLIGDLLSLVGPLSITKIVDYIDMRNKSLTTSIINELNDSYNETNTVNLEFDKNKTDQEHLNNIYDIQWNNFIENGWIIAIIVLFASLAQGTFSQASTHIVNIVGIRLRTSIQGLIYRKTLLISASCFFTNSNSTFTTTTTATTTTADAGGDSTTMNSSTNIQSPATTTIVMPNNDNNKIKCEKQHLMDSPNGKEQLKSKEKQENIVVDAGSITNLMSEDALNVMSFFWIAHYVWAIPLKIGVVMFGLYEMLGISAIVGGAVCISTMIPLQFLIGKVMSWNGEKSSECTDERLKKLNEVLHGIKIIKLNAWEKVFRDKIHNSRENELKYLNRDSIYWTIMTFLTHVSSVLITFVTLAVFISINGNDVEFTASRIFAALALFNQLTVPLFIFPITVPIIISAVISTRRLEAFLGEQEVQKEFEGIRNMARILCRSDASLDLYEREDESSCQIESEDNSQVLSSGNEESAVNDCGNISLNEDEKKLQNQQEDGGLEQQDQHQQPKQIKSVRVKLKKNNQLSMSTRMERLRSKQKSCKEIQIQISNDLVVSIRNAVFTWKRLQQQQQQQQNEFSLKIDKLDIPKGKLTIIVGKSGSGKTSLLAALLKEMQITSGSLMWNKYSTIAYVPQTSWLLNASIRDNILFGESFRPKRYDKVLEVCSLKPDIELMPGGDMSEIGERGINLSGGQRQRIAIARAIYSSANVIIMDDPLSSLDNEVAKWIFEQSIKKMLLKHKRTVIFVTQKTYLVQNCDYIIAMENFTVRAAGSYKDIEISDKKLIKEWIAIIAKENTRDALSPGRTARERWKLFKNVSRIGLRVNSVEDDPVSSSTSLYIPIKRRNSIFGSRHLTYDMPLPIDECNSDEVEFRRRVSSKRGRQCNSLELNGIRNKENKNNNNRTNSLIVDGNKFERLPVSRNISSPTTFLSNNNNNNNRISDIDGLSKTVGFRQFLHRMSSRKSNSTIHSRVHKTLSDSNSIKSIAEENHTPVKRLISDTSKCSEQTDDDGSIDFNEEISNRLIYDEERKYGKIPTRIYLEYLKSCKCYIVLIFCLCAFAWQTLRVISDGMLRGPFEEPPAFLETISNQNIEIFYYFKIFGILSGFCIFFSMISTSAGQLAGSLARKTLHEQLLNSIMQKSLYFFQITPIGRIMNRFSNDMSVIDKKIAATSQRLLQFILLCLCAILINMTITFWFILLTIPICGSYYMVQRFYRRSSREMQRIESITNSPILSHFSETIQGVTTIRAYNQESRFMEILFKRMEANNIAFIMLNTSNRWLGIALDYLGGIIVFVAIATALFTAHLYPESITPSLVGLAINYTLLVPIYLNWVVKLLSDMEMYIGAVERIEYYIENESHSLPTKIYKDVQISWPQKGDITFSNVTLRYEDQKQNIISNLNLTIPAGQRIGICGRTGSGKSTMVMSLFQVVELVSGNILIDDVDISTVHPDELRSRLSIIPQEVILFSGTIRENLDPRGHYTDLELWNCLETAQLKDLIGTLPMGLETEMIDSGFNLSGGQKQLFCLARSVLRGSVCLILDEATSSLDSVTEVAVLDAANRAFQGRTILTVAHRLATLLDYDRIIVMENGQIVEDGKPKELRSKTGGKFATMLNTSMQLAT